MEYLVSREEMKRCDESTINKYGVPAMVLMERAALAVTQEIVDSSFCLDRILVLCGTGNNGGDGAAIARLLFFKGYDVWVELVGDSSKCTDQTRQQFQILHNYGVNVGSNLDCSEYTMIVDALFGIGLIRPVTGRYAEVIQNVNKSAAAVLSVDIPSGICADTGRVLGIAVEADLTVTFAFAKLGTVLYPGASYTGKLTVKEIGITEQGFEGRLPNVCAYTDSDLKKLPKRKVYSNKGTYGKVLIIAGSCNMSGAAYLAAKAAYRAGAGLVRIYTPSDNRSILQTMLPEAILTTYDRFHIDIALLKDAIAWADVIGIGPGIGKGLDAKSVLNILLSNAVAPLVIDADGINILAEHIELVKEHKQEIIITPHLGEMSRILQKDVQGIAENQIKVAEAFAKEHQLICVLKDSRTAVTDGNGKVYINRSGNNGMATGGSGDVLTGIIIGLLAQKASTMEAAALGVYLHGLAGDEASSEKGQYGMMAHDIIDYLPRVMNRCHHINEVLKSDNK